MREVRLRCAEWEIVSPGFARKAVARQDGGRVRPERRGRSGMERRYDATRLHPAAPKHIYEGILDKMRPSTDGRPHEEADCAAGEENGTTAPAVPCPPPSPHTRAHARAGRAAAIRNKNEKVRVFFASRSHKIHDHLFVRFNLPAPHTRTRRLHTRSSPRTSAWHRNAGRPPYPR